MDLSIRKVYTKSTQSTLYVRRRLAVLFKRLFDLLAASLGLFFLVPIFAWIAWRIRRDSPGPVLYRGARMGRQARQFNILKFRTMYETPESYLGPRVTAIDDPRVTPYGCWLRATKLNELPQLWNVLKGEMSLVGPRPEDPLISKSWSPEALAEVTSVRPGITSPASVLYREEENHLAARPPGSSVMDAYLASIMPSKLRLDLLYVRNRSFLLDLDILFWTVLVLLPRLGRYPPPASLLFTGPFSRLFRWNPGWFLFDMSAALIAAGIVGLFWYLPAPPGLSRLAPGLATTLIYAALFAFIFGAIGRLLGAERVNWTGATRRDGLNLLVAGIIAGAGLSLLNYFVGPFAPLAILAAASLATLASLTLRMRSRLLGELATGWLKSRGEARAAQEKVLIVGGGQAGQLAAWLLSSGARAGVFHVAGFVDDDLYKQGMHIHGARVLGRRDEISRLVTELDIGVLVFAIHNIPPAERTHLLEICSRTPARLVLMPDILGLLQQVSIQNPGSDTGLSLTGWINGERPPGAIKAATGKLITANTHPSGPDELADWLDDLARIAQSGDLQALQAMIGELRSQDHTRPPAD